MVILPYLIVVGMSSAIALNNGIAQAASSIPPLSDVELRSLLADSNDATSAPSPNVFTAQSQQRPRETAVPEQLEPSANPLLFPTKPAEVQIQATQPITLEQALELARRNNRNLQVSQLQLESARAALREAIAAEYPSVDLNADLTTSRSASGELSAARQGGRILPPPFDQISQQSGSDDVSTSANGSLSLNYDLYTSGRRSASIKAAEDQVRFNELEVERLSEQTRLDITNGYYDLQEADEQVRINQSALEAAQRSLRDAELLERAGLGTGFDVLRARVRVENANQDLVRAQATQQTNRRRLAQLLSLSQLANISAADPVEIANLWNLSLEDSIVLAFKNRAELEQQLLQRNISDQRRRIALAGIRPQISLFANYNFLDVFDDDFEVADGYSVGARLRWSLFDGGASRSRARQEQANIAIAETRFADTRNSIRFQVEQAYFNLQANFKNIETTALALQQAAEALRLAELRFEAGVGTLTDVIQERTALIQAEVNRVRAILDYNRALASLQRAISNLPDSNLSEP